MLKYAVQSSRNKAQILHNLTFYQYLYVIAFKLCFQSLFLEPHLQIQRFDAFRLVKTNIAEFKIVTATEHEPKVKVLRYRYLKKRVVPFFNNLGF